MPGDMDCTVFRRDEMAFTRPSKGDQRRRLQRLSDAVDDDPSHHLADATW
jgi:hypothetical protein